MNVFLWSILLVFSLFFSVPHAFSDEYQATISSGGSMDLHKGSIKVLNIEPGLYESGWKGGSFAPGKTEPDQTEVFKGRLKGPSGILFETEMRPKVGETGVALNYKMICKKNVKLESLHVGLGMSMKLAAGREFTVDGEKINIPEELGETIHLYSGKAKTLKLDTTAGVIAIILDKPAQVLVQDNRKWSDWLAIRIGGGIDNSKEFPSGKTMDISFQVKTSGKLKVDFDMPVTIKPGKEWIPLDYTPGIEAGTVLDFSRAGFQDAPAGKYGYVIAKPDGTMEFEKLPGKTQRFYGVNFCFSGQYIEHEQADILAERLARTGYNTVRVHHYEGILVHGDTGGPDVEEIPVKTKPDKVEQLSEFRTKSEGDQYGARIRGYLYPPADGDYTFYIASDDSSSLKLSTDENPDNRTVIAHMEGYAGADQFDKYPDQKSKPITLKAGKKYYIEALHKEGSGGDHVNVAWEGPGIPFGIIKGEFLSPHDSDVKGTITREFWHMGLNEKPLDSVTLQKKELDKLDYLFAAFKKHGIYITTDLYVSRPVSISEVYPDGKGGFNFKMAVPVNEKAFENWKTFTRNLLTHRNPYTGLTYAEDPVLSWISLINEGNFGNYMGRMNPFVQKDWDREWNKWLLERYGSKAGLQKAWGKSPKGDPAAGSVPLYRNIRDAGSRQGADLSAFFAFVETRMFNRMKVFLKDELKCRALLTNMNGWTNRIGTQASRMGYEYVDDHFYVDHPHFLENAWSLPSSCPNTSPIATGAPGGRGNSFVRFPGKPFTISEYNYSGPGRFRGVGGILTGCLGALQEWGVIWRFAYSHNRANLFKASPANYFDLAADPLNQVAERAALCLYLRGDMKPAEHLVTVAVAEKDLENGSVKNHDIRPGWDELAWIVKVGTYVCKRGTDTVPGDVIVPVGPGAEKCAGADALNVPKPFADTVGKLILEKMKEKGLLTGNTTDLNSNRLQSETGQLTIDAPKDIMILNTPFTSGCYAPEGETVTMDVMTVTMDRTYATVWTSSVDGNPIRESKRLILCHLTDQQNNGALFGEKARKTLFNWGGLPHLVYTGEATARIKMEHAADAKVYEVNLNGKRMREVPAKAENGELVVKMSVRNPDGKARMIYEIAVE